MAVATALLQQYMAPASKIDQFRMICHRAAPIHAYQLFEALIIKTQLTSMQLLSFMVIHEDRLPQFPDLNKIK